MSKRIEEMTASEAMESILESVLAESKAENAKLREQMERLVTLLRVDCDIDASWDGLRRFWSIGLTEDGCLMRDRACKAEAENDKLRELVRDTLTTISWCTIDCCPSDSKKRELNARACELGIELNDCE
jgi:hypothetical protein